MRERIPVTTVAFEGLHRSGKGTQIEILKEKLESKGIPFIAIRGAGSRPNEDKLGDKYSQWWEEHSKKLKIEDSLKSDWIEGSRRLARETIVFRDRFLPEIAEKVGADSAVLLIDRSLLSHMAMLEDDELQSTDVGAVYGQRDANDRPVPSTEEVFPDILFYLKARPESLQARLDPDDPKYEFRRRNIENGGDAFDRAIAMLDAPLRERVVEIDANATPELVAEQIDSILKAQGIL